MNTPASTPFQQKLFDKFIEFQKAEGERKTLKEFAAYIGIGEKYFNLLLNGKRPPSDNVIDTLAEFFRDLSFYDVTGRERPRLRLNYVQKHWDEVEPEDKNRIAELVSRYTDEPIPAEDDCQSGMEPTA